MKKQWINYLILILLIPLTIWAGVTFFDDRKYVFISFVIVLLTIIPFFLSYERRPSNTRLMVILAVMVALSSVARILFAPIPAFKPVSAIIILTAIYFRAEAGFLVGALTALISNIYFGQGPWTPFQMFSWGMIGLIAGLPWVRRRLKRSYFALILFGLIFGFVFLFLIVYCIVIFLGVFY